jgi:nucleotide-binding universal stress UspA family protein
MATKKILFCTDFSENSLSARHRAVEFAKALGAQLNILHVVNASPLGYPIFEDRIPVDMVKLQEDIQSTVRQELQLVAQECGRDLAKSVQAHFLVGQPAAEIVRFADEHSIDLIVMGTHGWTGFRHLILGSTAENVVRTAKCPVLTVRGTVRGEG